MAMTIDSLLSEIESASASEDVRVAQEKLRALLDVRRYEREEEKNSRDQDQYEERVAQERSRRKLDAIRSLMEIDKSYNEPSKSLKEKKEIEEFKKVIKQEAGLSIGSLENSLYLHSEMAGGDGKDPIGILNDDSSTLSISAAMRFSSDPNSDIVTAFNGEWRIKIRDESDMIYDIITVEFINGESVINYTTKNKAAECYISEDDFDPVEYNGVIYSVRMVDDISFIVYKKSGKISVEN